MTRIDGNGGSTARDRAFAALAGLAVGDALGMPTQSLARADVIHGFGALLEGFEAPSPTHPFAAGLRAGSVTDDTQQAMILAGVLLETGDRFDVAGYASRLLEWELDVRRRGLFDLLGPSTKRALANIGRGMDVARSGEGGTTNGAAMRVAPVGIVSSSSDLGALVERVVEVSAPTHNTSIALSAACAVAAVVSAGVDGASLGDAIDFALHAARLGARHGSSDEGPGVADRIERAIALARRRAGVALVDAIVDDVGTSLESDESVPAAFALLHAYRGDVWGACCAAASLGGDTDTIGAMTGAMAGALAGSAAFPPGVVDFVEGCNGLDLARVAQGLLARRR